MLRSSNYDVERAASLVPFLYFVLTRSRSAKELAYQAAGSWLPAMWIGSLSLDDPLLAVVYFAAGYLCFISIYELGYLVNDAWDAYRHPEGRQRLWFKPGRFYLFLFVAVRITTWAVIGWSFGWIFNELWLASYAALFLAFGLHNIVTWDDLRAASFFQLSVLRFVVPIMGYLRPDLIGPAFLAALFFYTYFRFLSYLDSKNLLRMEARRSPLFGLVQSAMLAPLILLVAYATGAWPIAALLGYFLLLYMVWGWLAGSALSAERPDSR